MFKLVLEKVEEPEIKLPISARSWKKQDSSRKNIYFCLTDYARAFDYMDHNKLWKILKEMGLSDHLICLLRNLYADQEATVRTGHGTTDWFQIGKEYIKAVLSCMDVRVGLWRKLSAEELMLLKCGVGEDSWEPLGLQGDPTSPFWKRSALGFLWKEWC